MIFQALTSPIPSLLKHFIAFVLDFCRTWVKKVEDENPLITSSVFHYELEFIHPFSDGNGRMGRLWQTVILGECYPVFAYIPIESVVKEMQPDYYEALGAADKACESTVFIEFMLHVIREALVQFCKDFHPAADTAETRLDAAHKHFKQNKFTRKDYLERFKSLSTATASRDLKYGVERRLLVKKGDKRLSVYRFK